MKAIRIHAYGGPELMQLEDAPVPACGAGALLVRVVAAGVNPIDWKLRSGVMAAQIPKTFPITLGFDAAGIVTAVGGEVAGFEPRTASFAAAAALPMGGQAAWTALIETGQVERGMRVLIHGAAGALGTTAVQLAKEHGAHVTATASGKGMALVKSLGADEVIDYRTQRFEQVAHDIDVVLDTLGGATQQRAYVPPSSSRSRAERCWSNWPSVWMTGVCASSSARSSRSPTRPGRTASARPARRAERWFSTSARPVAESRTPLARERRTPMLQLRPMDTQVPIFNQLGEDLGPRHPNQRLHRRRRGCARAAQGLGRRCQLDEEPSGLHLHATAPRHRRQLRVSELCGVAIGGALSRGLHASGLSTRTGRLPL